MLSKHSVSIGHYYYYHPPRHTNISVVILSMVESKEILKIRMDNKINAISQHQWTDFMATSGIRNKINDPLGLEDKNFK